MSLIFLIGMPAAGKTYWGRKLAAAYNIQFIDLDEYIETSQGKTVPVIFEEQGEAAFRDLEAKALANIITTSQNTIISCGGGTPVFNNNIMLMRSAGCVVYLEAAIETLAQRIHTGDNVRPLINKSPYLLSTLQQMLNARESFYKQAHYILQVENLALANFDQIITSCTKPH